MGERKLYRADGSESCRGGVTDHFGVKSLVASRLTVNDCSGKFRSAPLTKGMNSSLHPSALRAEIKFAP